MGQSKAVLTVTRPRAAKMRKIIKRAAKLETLISSALYENNREYVSCHAPSKGMGADGCDNVGRCAMGELLFRIGYNNSDLEGLSPSGDWDGNVYKGLWDAYRIDKKDVEALIGSNDSVLSVDNEFTKRQVKVERTINKLDKKRGRVNPYLTILNNNGDPIGPMPTKKEVAVLEKFDVYNEFLNPIEEY